jgi:hypothetical protein
VVLNKVPKRGAGASYYGYEYQGGYKARPTSETPADKVDAR